MLKFVGCVCLLLFFVANVLVVAVMYPLSLLNKGLDFLGNRLSAFVGVDWEEL